MEELFPEELFYTRVEVEWSHFGDNLRLDSMRLHGCLFLFRHAEHTEINK